MSLPFGLISSIRIQVEGSHAHLHIWNRGGKAGVLTVLREDAEAIAQRLISKGGKITWIESEVPG